MNILLFLPSSNAAFDILSQATFLKDHGYNPIFLSSTPKGEMHHLCERHKIENSALKINSLSAIKYLSAAFKLSRFVKKKKIDLVLSNNLQGNFVATLAQFVHLKRTILTRHHSDYIFEGNNINAKRQQSIINKYGQEFIAISDRVKEHMNIEGVDSNKIYRINLGFDFNLIPEPNKKTVNELIDKHPESFRLCVVARLIPLKRHKLLFDAVLTVENRGIDVNLWIIGDGFLMAKLREQTLNSKIDHIVEFVGHVQNPTDYMSAADLLVHVSESEASSHVIREAGLVETPVLVCKDVGDFEDYIQDGFNGFFIEKKVNPKALADKILELSHNSISLKKSAVALKETVYKRFDIEKNGQELLKIIENE